MSVVTTGADGNGSLPITIGNEAADVPHALVHVAVYEPALTSFVVPVPPTDHVTVPLQPVAVKVAFSVPHTVDLLLVKVGAVGVAP